MHQHGAVENQGVYQINNREMQKLITDYLFILNGTQKRFFNSYKRDSVLVRMHRNMHLHLQVFHQTLFDFEFSFLLLLLLLTHEEKFCSHI